MYKPSNNPLNESLLTPKQAARLIPGRDGKRIDVSTVFRWINKGSKGIRLESWLIGGCRYTSREAIDRFIERRNADAPTPLPRNLRSFSKRAREHHHADEYLNGQGL